MIYDCSNIHVTPEPNIRPESGGASRAEGGLMEIVEEMTETVAKFRIGWILCIVEREKTAFIDHTRYRNNYVLI